MKLPVSSVSLPRAILSLFMIAIPAIMTADEKPSTAAARATETTNDTENETDDDASAPTKADPVAADYWRAIKLLGSKASAEIEAGRIALKAASDLEYTHAQVLLGNCHLAGSYGFPKNPKKAANLFRLAAERGNAFAKVSLGLCYVSGTGVKEDDETAMKWLTEATAPDADFNRPAPPADFFTADTGAGANAHDGLSGNLGEDPAAQSQATAHHLLGQILIRQKKNAEAQVHFVAAAGIDGRSGIFQAAQQAALNFAFGQGVPRDPTKANEMLDRARTLTARMSVTTLHNYASLKIVDEFAVADIEESITEAGAEAQTELQHEIATRFADKKSKDYNLVEAVKWYELAAENGKVWAMLSLAFIYVQGDLGQPDPTKAFQWFEKAGGGDKPKHSLGVANLGICYLHGIGVAKDPAKAAVIFQKHRDNNIICYLGSVGHCPEKIVTYEQALTLNQQWANEKNDPHAQYLLGRRYDTGNGVETDYRKAQQLYKKAIKANHLIALFRLAYNHDHYPFLSGDGSVQNGKKIAAELYRRGSELKHPDSMVNYAYMLMHGTGVAQNITQSVALYEECLRLQPNEYYAHTNLGAYIQERLMEAIEGSNPAETEKLRSKMLFHYESAIRGEQPSAAKNLGTLYRRGTLVGKDLRKAYQYYEQAVAWGSGAEAHFLLGLMHENGEGVPVTYSEAAYHYRLAALDGHIEALRHLVNFYLTGKGVSRDLDRATFWLVRMMRAGKPGVILVYADILLQKQEYQSAVELLMNLRNSENTFISGFAYDRLSQCYRNGQGVKPNPDKARQYFAKAVKLGNDRALTTLAMGQLKEGNETEGIANLEAAAKTSGPACFYLGQMNFFGTNMPKDRVKALRFFRTAADLEHPEALYFLAGLTYNREADAPSINEAIDLLQRAENVGHPKAGELREKLEKRRQKNLAVPEDTSKARSS